jgi:ABC-type glycerol-3-phosphate transport system substrate-binding protein
VRLPRKFRLTATVTLLVTALLGSAACGAVGGSAGDGSGTVNALVLLNPADKIVAEKILPEFQKKYPKIKVNWEMVPYAGGYTQKAQLSLANTKAPFDIVMWWDQLLPTTQQFLEPLDGYIKDSKFDLDDFDPAWRDAVTIDGKTYGIPWIADLWTFWYRQDLLKARGVEVPKTPEELLKACQALTDRSKKQYGYVMLGQRDPLQVMSWMPWLWANGGEVFDKDWHPQLASGEAARAGEYWKQLSQCAPPGSENYLHTDAMTAFASGNAVMGTMGIGWIGAVQQQNPQVAAKISYGGRIPGTGAANHSAHGWPFVISKHSRNKAAAWTFISYLTSAESFKTVATNPTGSHVVMARKTVYNDPAVAQVHPWVTQVREVVPYVRPKFNPGLGNPRGWSEIMDEIALRNSQILAGEKAPGAAYQEADAALKDKMKTFGYRQ